MGKFFSFTQDSRGMLYWFNWKDRQEILKGKLFDKRGQSITDADSHSQICAYYDLDCNSVNKYEFNFLTKKFIINQTNTKNRSKQAKEWARTLNSKEIVEPLIIKPLVNPFRVKWNRVTKKDIDNLKKWVCVWNSVLPSVGGSVEDSVLPSVGGSVWTYVWDYIWDSILIFRWTYVWDSVWAYFSSFFNLEKWKGIDHNPGENPFQPCIELWHRGFVIGFDGNVWKLHNWKGVVYEDDKRAVAKISK